MSYFPLPSRTSRASTFARTDGRRHTLRSRTFAILLISMLALPGVVPPVKIAAAPAPAPPTVQSPPEPFRTGAVSSVSALVPIAESVRKSLGEIGEIFSPSLPAGFESTRVPSLPERLMSATGPALAFFASTKSALRTPHSAIASLPPPTGTVQFDFDGDGKADIGRWQGSNTEFKVRNSTPSHRKHGDLGRNGHGVRHSRTGVSAERSDRGQLELGGIGRRCYTRLPLDVPEIRLDESCREKD